LFSNLAYNNWTMEEMSNGTAWDMLNRNNSLQERH